MAQPKATTAGRGMADNSGSQQTIEQLQRRFESLNTKKIQAETSLQHAREQLDKLQREAREQYGTDDVAALQSQLDKMKADNEQKRISYQAELDRIENDLAAVEATFATADGPNGDATGPA
jgi:chromosome segregation ATPase